MAHRTAELPHTSDNSTVLKIDVERSEDGKIEAGWSKDEKIEAERSEGGGRAATAPED